MTRDDLINLLVAAVLVAALLVIAFPEILR